MIAPPIAAFNAIPDATADTSPFAAKPWICYGNAMETGSTPSGATNSDTDSTASPTSKAGSFVVNFPLTPSEIEWLRAQSRRVGEVSDRLFVLAAKG
jgi:hypothetical protein